MHLLAASAQGGGMNWICEPSVCNPIAESFEQMCQILRQLPEEKQSEIAQYLKSLRYRKFLKTYYWKCVRKEVLSRARYVCSHCYDRRAVNAHHKSYANHGYEHLCLEELRALCKQCHEVIHGHREGEADEGFADAATSELLELLAWKTAMPGTRREK
jgi:5-methylcytosine-specific restriction endonuclease McrA